MLRMLLWKEWREQRWKFALGFIALGGFTLIGLRTRIVLDSYIVLTGAFVAGIALPLFVAMDLVAADRATGVLGSLLKLPVRPWKILLVKIALGALACAAPILLTALIACLVAGGREMTTSRILQYYAANAGLAVVFGWLPIAGVYGQFDNPSPGSLLSLHPVNALAVLENTDLHRLKFTVPVQLVFALALFCWAALRFSRLGRTPS